MKLTDIDENLAEAQPAGILARMGTKLKKHTPFNKAARDQAAGEEITQKAANEMAGAYNIWLGRVKAKGVNPKAVTVANLMDFFTKEGYAKTAKKVIQAAADKKQPKTETPPSDDTQQTGTDYTDQANQHLEKNKKPSQTQQVPNYGQVNVNTESLEARLAAMLTEAPVAQEVTFNPKEVNKLIMQIVATVEDEQPEALEKKVQGDAGDSSGGEADNIQQLETMWDQMVGSLDLSDKEAEVMKAAFDNARKIAAK